MALVTIKAEWLDMSELFEFCADRRAASPHYVNVCDRRVYDSYIAARKHNLRYNRKTNIMRDDRLGVLEHPSVPSEWDECDSDEARENLMREIWCAAVGQFNRESIQ